MKIKNQFKLSDITTLKIGGNAKYFCEVKSEKELLSAITFAKEKKLKTFIIGEGSDILIHDNGLNALVIKYLESNIDYLDIGRKVKITVGAGLIWDELVKAVVEKNLQGIECMSGIPGTVGAAPIQNIGAYGQELKDVFLKLRAFDKKKMSFVELSKNDCGFSYRESVFKSKDNWQKYIITKVVLVLNKDKNPAIKYESLRKYLIENDMIDPTLKQVRSAVLNIRSDKFENYKKFPNAGSFFKNPTVNKDKFKSLQKKYSDIPCFDNGDGTYKCFAAWFIEKAGWKGKTLGNAKVSSQHALVILNPQKKARAKDILSLSEKIIADVKKKFSIKLEPEVQYIDYELSK